RRTRLLAGRLQVFANQNFLAFADRGSFGINALFTDALHAVSAFFHDATAADGDVRIAHQLELRRLPILKQQEIKPSHLIRTVIRAVTCADAAVIDHGIQAFAAVQRGLHRTNQLAGRILALHAGDGLKEALGIFARAIVISVHAQPVHVAAAERLILANHGDVILRLAGDDAVIAPDAGVQVDCHTPGVSLLGIVDWRLVECKSLRRLAFFREAWLFLVLVQIAILHQRALAAIRSFHRLITLRAGELVDFSRGAQLRAARKPRSLAGAQRIDIEALLAAHASGVPAAVTEEGSNAVIGMASLNPDGAFDFLAVEFQFDDVFRCQLQALGHRGTDHDGVVPGQLGQRLRTFL